MPDYQDTHYKTEEQILNQLSNYTDNKASYVLCLFQTSNTLRVASC